MHHLTGARLTGVALFASLCACSGGGDENQVSRQIDLSTDSLSFSATAPTAATPAAQTITATFAAELTNLSVMHSGRGVAKVETTVTGATAQIVVTPSSPATLGAGQFTDTIAVTGYFCANADCSRLEAGGSQTVTAKYQVSPLIDFVAPNVAVSGVSATAIIRGVGFRGYAIEAVKFGGIAATSKTFVSDTEIQATYPALTAGSYPVTIDIPSHQGTPLSTATLIVVDPVAYTAQALAWPGPVTAVRALHYDAQRGALLAATDIGGGTIVRYPYAAGAWGTPATVAVADLQDADLVTDGGQLLALSKTRITPLDPATLVPATPVDAPSLPTNSFLKNLGVANSDQAVVTTGIAESKATLVYTYAARTGVMAPSTLTLNNATPGTSANGAVIGLIQGDPSLTAAPAVYTFTASSGGLAASSIALNQNSIAPVLDRDATRLVLNGLNIYGADFALLGKLPATTLAVALRPDGKRAYTYDSAAGGLLTFDISATKNGEAYVALGAAVALAAAPGENMKMTISPDGNTLFIAGTTQLVVQPTPVAP